MRPTEPPARAGNDPSEPGRRDPGRGRGFTRRIECDGGYSTGPARGGEMREPATGRERQDDPGR